MHEGTCSGCQARARLISTLCAACLVEGCRAACSHLEHEYDSAVESVQSHNAEIRRVIAAKNDEKDLWIEKYTRWYEDYSREMLEAGSEVERLQSLIAQTQQDRVLEEEAAFAVSILNDYHQRNRSLPKTPFFKNNLTGESVARLEQLLKEQEHTPAAEIRELDLRVSVNDQSVDVRLGRQFFSLKGVGQPFPPKRLDPHSRLYHSTGDFVQVLLQMKEGS